MTVLGVGGTEVAWEVLMGDIRFQSFEDGDLADVWYALSGAAIRHPEHFKSLTDAVLDELVERRSEGLNPWLEQRFRAIRQVDSKEDAEANKRIV